MDSSSTSSSYPMDAMVAQEQPECATATAAAAVDDSQDFKLGAVPDSDLVRIDGQHQELHQPIVSVRLVLFLWSVAYYV